MHSLTQQTHCAPILFRDWEYLDNQYKLPCAWCFDSMGETQKNKICESDGEFVVRAREKRQHKGNVGDAVSISVCTC